MTVFSNKAYIIEKHVKKPHLVIVIGLIFILVGVICNQWILSQVFSIDDTIATPLYKIIIWFFDITCIVFGMFIIMAKPSILKIAIAMLIFTLLFSLTAETAIRFFNLMRNKGKNVPTFIRYSKSMGWEVMPQVLQQTYYLNSYGFVKYLTNENGFRSFGDINSKKKKILIIGDSYTHAINISNGYTYYDYLARHHPNIEVFSYGCLGYGFIQEYLILDRYFNFIKPDIILWQFCSNDLSDNCFELNNNRNRITLSARAYYINGTIELR